MIRPALTPVLPCLIGAWAGIIVGNGRYLDAGAFDWAALLLVLAIGVACVLLRPRLRSRGSAHAASGVVLVSLLLAGMGAGMIMGYVSARTTSVSSFTVAGASQGGGDVLITSDAQPTSKGTWYAIGELITPEGIPRVKAYLQFRDIDPTREAPPLAGQVLAYEGDTDVLDPATSDFAREQVSQGVGCKVYVRAWRVGGIQPGPIGVIRAWRSRIIASVDAFSDGAWALIVGVVCGYRAPIKLLGITEDFAVLGLSHMVAVSGAHLAVVAMLVGWLLERMGLKPMGRFAGATIVLATYVVLSGFQPSALRAWCMVTAARAGQCLGRRSHAFSALSLTALTMILITPSYAFSMGFRLSVLSVGGLTVFAGWATALFGRLLPSWVPSSVSQTLGLTTVAQLFCMPLTVPLFGSVSILSPLANLLAAPVMSLALCVGMVALPLGSLAPPVLGILAMPVTLAARILVEGASLASAIPYACVPLSVDGFPLAVALTVSAVVIYAWWPLPSRFTLRMLLAMLAAFVLAQAMYWGLLCPARMVVLDVGQGDAILVQQGRSAFLLDTGPDASVVEALMRNHVMRLDAVILSHTDTDHTGGLAEVLRRFPVDEVIVADGVGDGLVAMLAGDGTGVALPAVREVGFLDVLRFGSWRAQVIWPEGPVAGGENRDSLVLLLTQAGSGDGQSPADGSRTGASFLLTGDAEVPELRQMVAGGFLGHVDVLKVGHHGSAESLDEEVVATLCPVLAIASAGAGNAYGHPTDRCIDLLAAVGARFECTSWSGDIEVRPQGSGIRLLK